MKLPFWGTILTVFGVFVLCSLGYWQLHRLQWKAEILADMDAQYEIDAPNTPVSLDFPSDNVSFRRGYLTGIFDYDKSIMLQPRVHDGEVGYHVITPFTVGGEIYSSILVNLGWVPFDWERPSSTEGEEVKIIGMLRKLHNVSSFVPENAPDEDMWYKVDVEQISRIKGIEGVSPNIFYVEDNAGGDKYPIAAATRVKINNNHAQYALFWFSMAVAMIAIYILRFVVPIVFRNK